MFTGLSVNSAKDRTLEMWFPSHCRQTFTFPTELKGHNTDIFWGGQSW